MLYYINIKSSPGTVSCGGGHILVQIQINEITRMVSLKWMTHLGSPSLMSGLPRVCHTYQLLSVINPDYIM